MRLLWICVKYFLWSILSVIVFLLLVGLAKSHWSVSWYVQFLNTNDWSVFTISNVSTWADPFWPTGVKEDSIEDILSDEELESEMDALDVYDPSFEADLNAIVYDEVAAEDESFGFSVEK